MEEHRENFIKDIKHKKEWIRVEKYNNWNKKYAGGNQSRLDNTEEHISDWEDRIVEITQLEQQKEVLKSEDSLRDC